MKRRNKEMEIDSTEVESRNSKRKRRCRSKRKNKRRPRNDFDDKYKKINTSTDHSSILIVEIPSDIQFKILSYLPAKSLFRFKCVSKEFQSFIVLEYSRRQAFTGFFAIGDHRRGYKPSFKYTISTDAGGGGLPDSSLSFLKAKDQLEDQVKILDSCNGLLLCEIISSTESESAWRKQGKLYVCNPLTKQKVFVPFRGIGDWWSCNNHFALIAQSTSMGYLRYKVVYIYGGCVQYSKMWMYSSATGEWEEFRYRLPSVIGLLMYKRPRIFIEGTTLIWDCFASGKYILVCYLNNKLASSSRGFDLIQCPCDYQYMRSLWDYNGKILFYFNERLAGNRELGKLSTWSLCFGDNNNIGWKKEDPLQLKTLAKDLWKYWSQKKYLGREVLPRFEIVRYNPSLKTMYVSIGGVVISYKHVERRSELFWKSKSSGCYEPNVVFPYVHSLEPIEIGITDTAIGATVDDEAMYFDVDDGDDYPICVEDDGLELIC